MPPWPRQTWCQRSACIFCWDTRCCLHVRTVATAACVLMNLLSLPPVAYLLPAGVSQLYDRLGDMEAAMRELAHAQATSSSVLSELGGRLSTGPGSTWASQAGVGSASPGRLSARRLAEDPT